eukprot:9048098-Alexandrium_andersonii.AAC.1
MMKVPFSGPELPKATEATWSARAALPLSCAGHSGHWNTLTSGSLGAGDGGGAPADACTFNLTVVAATTAFHDPPRLATSRTQAPTSTAGEGRCCTAGTPNACIHSRSALTLEAQD